MTDLCERPVVPDTDIPPLQHLVCCREPHPTLCGIESDDSPLAPDGPLCVVCEDCYDQIPPIVKMTNRCPFNLTIHCPENP